MVAINLTPWRDRRQHYESSRLTRCLVGAVLFSFLFGVIGHVIVSSKLNGLRAHVAALQNDMSEFADLQRQLEESKKRNDTLRQLENGMFQYQAITEDLFSELAKISIRDVCFNGLSRDKNILIFSGYARSSTELMDFLMHWRIGKLFSEVKIQYLRAQMQDHSIQFRFQAEEKNALLLSSLKREAVDKDVI